MLSNYIQNSMDDTCALAILRNNLSADRQHASKLIHVTDKTFGAIFTID